jgi:hypothetical protein
VRDSVVAIDEVVVRSEAPDAVVQARSATLTTSIGRGELKKAACCNLSESFETNPAIDAAPKGNILEQYMALTGHERSAFFAANRSAIMAALRN